jgi:nucleoside-diphosphate-sugar epimerase
MPTSLITGGAGFLGSHLVDALVKRRESVIVIDNLSTGRLGNLERAISSGRVTFAYADVHVETDELRNIVALCGAPKLDFIYHLVAAQHWAAGSMRPEERGAADLRGVASAIEIAIEHGARLIALSTPGNDGPTPDLLSDLREAEVAQAIRQRGLDARVVRVYDCYGPRAQTGDPVVAELLNAALNRRPMPIEGTGRQLRALTYVTDAVNQLVTVAVRLPSAPEPVNIVSGDERSVIEIARIFARAAGVHFSVQFVSSGREFSARRRALHGNAVTYALPATSLEAGLRKTYDWFANESRQFV